MIGTVNYTAWFLNYTGPILLFGFCGAFALSRFSGLSATARSRCALSFSLIIAVLGAAQPQFNDGSRGQELVLATAAAFGLAFAICRLRLSGGRSILGWLCGIGHVLLLVDSAQELSWA